MSVVRKAKTLKKSMEKTQGISYSHAGQPIEPTGAALCRVENTNSAVTALVESGTIKRILAQVDVVFSNSMIEAWWRMIKHQWLYLNELDSGETVRKLVAFYVEQHNTHVPHSAFRGWQTPDEMYFSKGAEVPEQLQAARIVARQARRESNLAQRCNACTSDTQIVRIYPKKADTT